MGKTSELILEVVFENVARHFLDELTSRDEDGVVVKVNTILGGAEDPVGVAAWWCQENGFLGNGEAPVDWIGTSRAKHLITLATDLAEWSG